MSNISTLYHKSACDLNLSTYINPYVDGFNLKLGKRHYLFYGAFTSFNTESSAKIAGNKYCMNKILKTSGFPVPTGHCIHITEFSNHAVKLPANMNFPYVVKPTSGTLTGYDVLCNINDFSQLHMAMEKRFQRHECLTIEEFHKKLNSYRVLVFYKKVIGVAQRFPAHVIGDGIHSIKELISIVNAQRRKLADTFPLGPIKIDEECHIRLKELNMTEDTIPKDKETVVLCYTCNSTRGGTSKSLGKRIAKKNARLLCAAAEALNLNLVGFDVECEDICLPFKNRDAIIEANTNPDILMHENPMSGIKNRVSMIMLKRLIIKHPLSYFLLLCKRYPSALYIKSSFLISIFWGCAVLVAWK